MSIFLFIQNLNLLNIDKRGLRNILHCDFLKFQLIWQILLRHPLLIPIQLLLNICIKCYLGFEDALAQVFYILRGLLKLAYFLNFDMQHAIWLLRFFNLIIIFRVVVFGIIRIYQDLNSLLICFLLFFRILIETLLRMRANRRPKVIHFLECSEVGMLILICQNDRAIFQSSIDWVRIVMRLLLIVVLRVKLLSHFRVYKLSSRHYDLQ